MGENRISGGDAKSKRRNFLSLAAAATAGAVASVLAKSNEALAGHDASDIFHLGVLNNGPAVAMPTRLAANVDLDALGPPGPVPPSAALMVFNGDGATSGKGWGFFGHGNPGSAGGVFGNTGGSGPGVLGVSASTGPGVEGHSVSGSAGRFENSNSANGSATLEVFNNGGGRSAQIVSAGSGAAAYIEATSPTNGSSTLLVINRTAGRAVDVLTDNASNSEAALAVRSTGQGRAGRFVKDNPSSGTPAVEGVTSGSGPGVRGEGSFGPGVEGKSHVIGVRGEALGSTPGSVGVVGISAPGPGVSGYSPGGPGVLGLSDAPVGPGVLGTCAHGPGVRGLSTLGSGVSGEGREGIANGVSGIANAAGVGVLGHSSSGPGVEGTSSSGPGVRGMASQTGPGVEGFASTGTQPGVTGRPGVVGHASSTNSGVVGDSEGLAPAIFGHQAGPSGVAIRADAAHVDAIGLTTMNAQGGIALDVRGRARFTTAGNGTIPAKADSQAVSNTAVRANSNVIATLTSDPGEAQIAWIERNPGSGFVLHFTMRLRNPTSFAYLITESA